MRQWMELPGLVSVAGFSCDGEKVEASRGDSYVEVGGVGKIWL